MGDDGYYHVRGCTSSYRIPPHLTTRDEIRGWVNRSVQRGDINKADLYPPSASAAARTAGPLRTYSFTLGGKQGTATPVGEPANNGQTLWQVNWNGQTLTVPFTGQFGAEQLRSGPLKDRLLQLSGQQTPPRSTYTFTLGGTQGTATPLGPPAANGQTLWQVRWNGVTLDVPLAGSFGPEQLRGGSYVKNRLLALSAQQSSANTGIRHPPRQSSTGTPMSQDPLVGAYRASVGAFRELRSNLERTGNQVTQFRQQTRATIVNTARGWMNNSGSLLHDFDVKSGFQDVRIGASRNRRTIAEGFYTRDPGLVAQGVATARREQNYAPLYMVQQIIHNYALGPARAVQGPWIDRFNTSASGSSENRSVSAEMGAQLGGKVTSVTAVVSGEGGIAVRNNGGQFTVVADYNSMAGPTAGVIAKLGDIPELPWIRKRAQSETASARATVESRVGSGSRTVYSADTLEDAERIAALVDKRMRNPRSLTDAEYAFLGRHRTEVRQSAIVRFGASLGGQVNLNLQLPGQSLLERVKPAFLRGALGGEGRVRLETRPYISYLPARADDPARLRLGTILATSGMDVFYRNVQPRMMGTELRRNELVVQSRQREDTGVGDSSSYVEYELSPKDVERIERADGKVTPEHAVAIIASGRPLSEVGVAQSSRSRESPVAGFDGQAGFQSTYRDVSASLTTRRPTTGQALQLLVPTQARMFRAMIIPGNDKGSRTHAEIATQGGRVVERRFTRADHSPEVRATLGRADVANAYAQVGWRNQNNQPIGSPKVFQTRTGDETLK